MLRVPAANGTSKRSFGRLPWSSGFRPAGRQACMQPSSHGSLPGQASGQQSSLLGGLNPRSYQTSWEDLPEHVAREITQRTNENDKIALFFASKQTRHPSMPLEIA